MGQSDQRVSMMCRRYRRLCMFALVLQADCAIYTATSCFLRSLALPVWHRSKPVSVVSWPIAALINQFYRRPSRSAGMMAVVHKAA